MAATIKALFNVCLVSDFFFPNSGGVESHIYQLGYCLKRRGHHVVIVTHRYGTRCGVRLITGGIKVYYLPLNAVYNQACLPTGYSTTAFMRYIFIREQIDIVHGHAAFSALAQESILHARCMGLKTVFTDHSLFGFADLSSILTNLMLKFTLSHCHNVICVSHTSKENTVLRAALNPLKVFVIPNAVDGHKFPPRSPRTTGPVGTGVPVPIVIVIMSRLVYRKGVDLMAGIIPAICQKYNNINFIVGGDGPMRITLEEMREKCNLQHRVEMLGNVEHDAVALHLRRGDIFLNTSLTEAFCMAIVEAASSGLLVVSTRVGGIPEVLPPDMIRLADASVEALVQRLQEAVSEILAGSALPPHEMHARISRMYTWTRVAERTEKVYRELDRFNEPFTTLRTTMTMTTRRLSMERGEPEFANNKRTGTGVKAGSDPGATRRFCDTKNLRYYHELLETNEFAANKQHTVDVNRSSRSRKKLPAWRQNQHVRAHLNCYRRFFIVWRFAFSLIALFNYFLLRVLDWWQPAALIPRAKAIPFLCHYSGCETDSVQYDQDDISLPH